MHLHIIDLEERAPVRYVWRRANRSLLIPSRQPSNANLMSTCALADCGLPPALMVRLCLCSHVWNDVSDVWVELGRGMEYGVNGRIAFLVLRLGMLHSLCLTVFATQADTTTNGAESSKQADESSAASEQAPASAFAAAAVQAAASPEDSSSSADQGPSSQEKDAGRSLSSITEADAVKLALILRHARLLAAEVNCQLLCCVFILAE